MPLYLLGRQLRTVAPIAFLPAGHALSIAVFSYRGSIVFGLLGDYDRMYDLDVVADGLEEALAALEQERATGADGHERRASTGSDRGPARTRPPV